MIQRLGFVFNYYSLEFRFYTVFMPVSPPPYLNGGPEFLSWVVEATETHYDPTHVTKALRSVLPENVGSEAEWTRDDTE